MKLSEQWLREWVNPPLTLNELSEQLTLAGFETEAVEPVAGDFNNVIVAEVKNVVQHPDADRLRICQVNDGESQLQIVCGAANVRAGLKVPLAKVGAKLPGDLIIKPTKLRGVESMGMLCSATELGLAETSEGLLELPADAPVGIDIRDYLQLNDCVIELNITPNRGDCLSVAGMSREVATLNRLDIKPPQFKTIKPSIDETFSVGVTAKQDCPRYVGRIIKDVDLKSSSPIWLCERLRRSGIRSINAVVDITNYVMLELGQPLHAFDLEKLAEKIIVRHAHAGEEITLLDGQTVQLNEHTLVVADNKQPQAIAGVMGGLQSGVGEQTRHIFLESAFFNPITIAISAKHFGLYSDSSHRFERGVDPELQQRAIECATQLIIEIAGGKAGPVTEVAAKTELPITPIITLRKSRIQRILGIEIPDREVENILSRLGMQLRKIESGWEATVPSFRFDVKLEIDLIEELARIYGYQRIPLHRVNVELRPKPAAETHISINRIRECLVDHGYHEAITYSFIAPELQQLIDPTQASFKLLNPISQDMSVMRSNLWPGLLQALQRNQRRQEKRVRLFESGLCFTTLDGELSQTPKLAAVIAGSAYPEQWGIADQAVDFFDVKADVEAVLSLSRPLTEFRFVSSQHPALHPGKTAAIYLGQSLIGHIGGLHPELQLQLDLKGTIYLFELDLLLIQNGLLPIFKAISKFPAVRRDVAFILPQEVAADAINEKIISISGELLQNVQLFDIYQGKGIDLGKKSMALGLTFQHPSRTLIDNEVNELVLKIITVLNNEFGAKLRE